MQTEFTADQVKEMREWLLDCATNYEELERIEDAADSEIVKWTEKTYDGGTAAFLEAIG